MKKIIILSIMILSFAFIFANVEDYENFDVQGHRGCRGLMPENTLAGFEYAIEELNVNTIELDVGITKDKILVLNHDTYLNPSRTSKNGEFLSDNTRIYIKDLTLDEIKEYDVGILKNKYSFPDQKQIEGEKIPTLQEVIDLVKAYEEETGKRVRMNIETKINVLNPDETFSAELFEDLLLDIIYQNEIQDQVSVQSFYWKTIMDIKESNPEIITVALISNSRLRYTEWFNGLDIDDFDSFAEFIAASNADVLSMSYKDLKREYITDLQGLGIKVIPYTINDVYYMKKFIARGVDGIITDYPNYLNDLLGREY